MCDNPLCSAQRVTVPRTTRHANIRRHAWWLELGGPRKNRKTNITTNEACTKKENRDNDEKDRPGGKRESKRTDKRKTRPTGQITMEKRREGCRRRRKRNRRRINYIFLGPAGSLCARQTVFSFRNTSWTEKVRTTKQSLHGRNCAIVIAESLTRTQFESVAFVGGPFYFLKVCFGSKNVCDITKRIFGETSFPKPFFIENLFFSNDDFW